jgi:hypothetical protein
MAKHHKREQNMVEKTMKHFVLLYKMVYSQNRDTQTYPVMGNRDSFGLASQASAEYGQEDNRISCCFTKWFTRKIVIHKVIR